MFYSQSWWQTIETLRVRSKPAWTVRLQLLTSAGHRLLHLPHHRHWEFQYEFSYLFWLPLQPALQKKYIIWHLRCAGHRNSDRRIRFQRLVEKLFISICLHLFIYLFIVALQKGATNAPEEPNASNEPSPTEKPVWIQGAHSAHMAQDAVGHIISAKKTHIFDDIHIEIFYSYLQRFWWEQVSQWQMLPKLQRPWGRSVERGTLGWDCEEPRISPGKVWESKPRFFD